MSNPIQTTRTPKRIQFLKDVLTTAMEGGINYWGQVSDYDPEAGTATVWEKEEAEINSDGSLKYPQGYEPDAVDIDTIARGISILLEQRKDHDPTHYWHQFVIANRTNSEDGDYDSTIADDILQAGIWDEIRYG